MFKRFIHRVRKALSGSTGSIFDQFTDRARKAMALANQAAQRLNHEYIGTEHVLMGLVKEGSGVGANVLKNLGVDLRKVRVEVAKFVKSGPDMVTIGRLPQTPRTRTVIDYARDEASKLGHNYVGTEHLLLGLLREREGVAAHVLVSLGLPLTEVRKATLSLLGMDDPTGVSEHAVQVATGEAVDAGASDEGLAELLDVAADLARQRGDVPLTSEHVLMAMLQLPDSKPARALAKLGVTREAVVDALRDVS